MPDDLNLDVGSTLMSGEIDRVRLTYPTTEIVLYRVSDKPKPKWKIRYPVEAEADLNEVRMLLFRLEDLKAMSSPSQSDPPASQL